MKRWLSSFGAAVFLAGSLLNVALAASYPNQPIVYVVPYAPGGTSDNIARVLAEHLSVELGQPFIIENKPGAGGTLGTAYVANARPDGYTLLNAAISNLAIGPQLNRVSYDPFKDLIPLAAIAGSRSVIAINPDLPINTLEELIAYAKANPGKLSYGSSGNGSTGNLSLEYLNILAGIDLVHIPYRGSALALTDAIAGHIHLISDPLANGAVKSGHLRGLAYFGSQDGSDLPGTPALTDVFPQWGFGGSFFAVAPAGTPPEVLARLRDAFGKVLAKPEVIEKLKSFGLSPESLSPEELAKSIRDTHEVSAEIIRRTQLKTQ